ncbi:hypothetical protein EsDP_00006717 [Epichloe bromicola]|uniref:Uncharacterized protein n=1 Tax=Epichloe bromicola TaxID=79588 RepID=A0ABQ0CYF4_9HYPO
MQSYNSNILLTALLPASLSLTAENWRRLWKKSTSPEGLIAGEPECSKTPLKMDERDHQSKRRQLQQHHGASMAINLFQLKTYELSSLKMLKNHLPKSTSASPRRLRKLTTQVELLLDVAFRIFDDDPESDAPGDAQSNGDGKARTRNASTNEEIFVLCFPARQFPLHECLSPLLATDGWHPIDDLGHRSFISLPFPAFQLAPAHSSSCARARRSAVLKSITSKHSRSRIAGMSVRRSPAAHDFQVQAKSVGVAVQNCLISAYLVHLPICTFFHKEKRQLKRPPVQSGNASQRRINLRAHPIIWIPNLPVRESGA